MPNSSPHIQPDVPTPLAPVPRRTRASPAAAPVALTSLIGREREVEALSTLLRRADVRLVVLTGPGGVGKTRLALRVAAELQSAFLDGVQYVGLASITDARLLTPAIAQAIGVQEAGDRSLRERLKRVLRDQELLLILDGFEQVTSAAPVITDILAACPGVKVLVTSRALLRVTGERDFPVPPLLQPRLKQLPPDQLMDVEAVRLFVERAQAVSASFALTDANAGAIAEICLRLDGLPLAIELAAARVRHLRPEALLGRLERRLPVLTGGPLDLPTRQRSLRETIAWSYDLLPAEEQTLFRRLAVLAGGFTLDAAEAVVAASRAKEDARRPEPRAATRAAEVIPMRSSTPLASPVPLSVLDGVSSLIDKSLVQQQERDDGEPRFTMLETIREFGLEELRTAGEEDATRRAHAEWYLALAVQAEPELYGGARQAQWLNRLETEHDNLRAALSWAEDADEGELGLRLGGALFWFWYVHGYLTEGRRWLKGALARGDAAPAAVRARALLGAGMLAHRQDDTALAVPLLEESLRLSQASDDALGASFALGLIGITAEDAGEYDQAARLYEEALALVETDDRRSQALKALTLAHQGVVAWGQADLDRAVALLEEALTLHRAIDDTWGVANAMSWLALVAHDRRDLELAARLARESLSLFWAAGAVEDVAGDLANAATISSAQGKHIQAIRLFAAAENLRDHLGCGLRFPERAVYERAIGELQATIGAQTFATARAAGWAMSSEQAVSEALDALDQQGGTLATPSDHKGLTRREQDVLRLLVAGRTDREIAAALFISPRTAQGHVAHLFAKLGVSTRTAAVAAALQADLIADPSNRGDEADLPE